MLQQILQDLWVDPEILAELDEAQKQTLFCKMREEQVRRWNLWDSATPVLPLKSHHRSKKKVDFLLGADGHPWVWVMGEHKDDKTIDEILEKEAREEARKMAEKEAEQLRSRLAIEAELTEFLEMNKKNIEQLDAALKKSIKDAEEPEEIYCTADELRIRGAPLPSAPEIPKRDALQEISFNKPHKVSQRVALWEKRLMEERSTEIYNRMQKKKQDAAKEAEDLENKQEQAWREQQKKAKEAELQMREIARRAREEHRRSAHEDIMPPPTLPKGMAPIQHSNPPPIGPKPVSTTKPPSKDAIVEWFRSSQISRRAGLEPNSNVVAPWFHGLITRQEAETLLKDQPPGSFLVRVSERIWGYAISYKDTDRCKHYLIDASSGHYQFLGNNQITHNTLGDLVSYHGARPITAMGGEILGRPCHRNESLPAIFQGLAIRAR